jgi:very-short-patch-repair endonuclease
LANENARNLRKHQTDAERKLWRALRGLKSRGFHFRRQVPIDHLIVDFACHAARVVIEVDGGQHNETVGHATDAARDAHLRRNGFHVLRFWNNDVMANPEGVVEVVLKALRTNSTPPTPGPSPRGGGGRSPSP